MNANQTRDALADLKNATRILKAIQVISDISPECDSGPILRVQTLTLRALENLRPTVHTLELFRNETSKEVIDTCPANATNSE